MRERVIGAPRMAFRAPRWSSRAARRWLTPGRQHLPVRSNTPPAASSPHARQARLRGTILPNPLPIRTSRASGAACSG